MCIYTYHSFALCRSQLGFPRLGCPRSSPRTSVTDIGRGETIRVSPGQESPPIRNHSRLSWIGEPTNCGRRGTWTSSASTQRGTPGVSPWASSERYVCMVIDLCLRLCLFLCRCCTTMYRLECPRCAYSLSVMRLFVLQLLLFWLSCQGGGLRNLSGSVAFSNCFIKFDLLAMISTLQWRPGGAGRCIIADMLSSESTTFFSVFPPRLGWWVLVFITPAPAPPPAHHLSPTTHPTPFHPTPPHSTPLHSTPFLSTPLHRASPLAQPCVAAHC